MSAARDVPTSSKAGVSESTASLPLASFNRRAVGYALDALVLLVVNFSVTLALSGIGQTGVEARLVVLSLDSLYGAVLIHSWGSTLGMVAVKISAVDKLSSETLPWGRSWMRAGSATVFVSAIPLVLSLGGMDASGSSTSAGGASLTPLLESVGFISFLWAKYDALGQTLQDKIARSVVVTEERHTTPSATSKVKAGVRSLARPNSLTHRSPMVRFDRTRRR